MAAYPKSRHETVTDDKVELSGDASSLLIKNAGASPVAVGSDQLTYATGFILAAGDTIFIALDAHSDKLWFVCDTGQSTTLHFLEQD